MPQDNEFVALSKALDSLRDGNEILTDPFLEVCRGVLPVIGEEKSVTKKMHCFFFFSSTFTFSDLLLL